MENYRFQLEKSSKKHICPSCGKNRFVRFIDASTKQYLPAIYGRCDREANCNYFLSPYADNFAVELELQENENRNTQWQSQYLQASKHQPPELVCIPDEILQATRNRPLSNNTFIQNLATNIPFPFEMDDLEKVANLYQLGTLTKGIFAGAISFPFIDSQNRVRAIQIKQFDKQNHTIETSFIHAIIAQHKRIQNEPLPSWLKAYQQQEKKVSCLFGQHLLSYYPHNPIALVEAPKTCIYATLYFGFPEQDTDKLLWLSTFNLSSLTKEKTIVLQGRTVVLFPDLSVSGEAFNIWNTKAKQFEKEIPGTRFIVSDLLEQNATTEERQKGFDLADYLIMQNWKHFRNPDCTSLKDKNPPQQLNHEPEAIADKPLADEPIEITPKEHNILLIKTALNLDQPNKPESSSTFDQFVDFDLPPEEPKQLWNLTEIEDFFSNLEPFPTAPIQLSQGHIITNPAKFVASHLATVKTNNGLHTFEPYLLRLVTLKKLIENE